MRESDKIVFRDAIKKYGEKLQLTVAIEELSELQKEICKVLRGNGSKENLTEEIADVYIMLEQLKLIIGIPNKSIELVSNFKVDRLKYRLDELKNKGV